MVLVRYVGRISFVYFSLNRFRLSWVARLPLNFLSRLFALLCFTLLSDFVYFFLSFPSPDWRCRRVPRQFMVGAKHRPRLRSHLSYPHNQDHHLLPPSPKPISDGALGFGGRKAEGIKSYYFLLSFSSFQGVICLISLRFFPHLRSYAIHDVMT